MNDIAKLMGAEDDWNQERSNQILELILESITARANLAPGSGGTGRSAATATDFKSKLGEPAA